ncbi:MAG: ATP-binding protein [bacterium]
MASFFKSLKFQIGLALTSLAALFFYFSLYTLSVLDDQRAYATLIRLAGELKLTYQHMSMQAMNYHENAPRDYDTYYRDLKLYYQDLMTSTNHFGEVSEAFSSGNFAARLTLSKEFMAPDLEEETREAAHELNAYWLSYNQELQNTLGPEEEPRLEWAAEYISAHSKELAAKTDRLLQALEADILERNRSTNQLVKITFVVALALIGGILSWFYFQVLRPLGKSVQGFRKVATGDFGYKVEVSANNEIGWLTQSFNHLSGRLDALFGLSTRMQQGGDLDETLAYVSRALPELLPLDWVGALMLVDDTHLELSRAYAHGHRESVPVQRFELQGSLLEQCLQQGKPLHIPDITDGSLHAEDQNPFLRLLASQHGREAVLMPVTEQSPIPVVLVFASRSPRAYREEHLDLLSNLSVVIAVSFARTLKLVEHGRLAAIGEFASGIAHEIRNPLATISLALEHFDAIELPEASQKRVQLASGEVTRLNRLLEEILLYAKPLQFHQELVSSESIISSAFGAARSNADQKHVTLVSRIDPDCTEFWADSDRLTQVMVNLVNNAVEATPENNEVIVETASATEHRDCQMSVRNPGPVVPQEHLDKLFQPFYTTKPSGTGLGLAIVQRLVNGMGGSITVSSDNEQGTRFTVTLPAKPA